MLQVANDSDEEEERLSESLVVSFFCLVRRFWNHTLTCGDTTRKKDKMMTYVHIFVFFCHMQTLCQ